MSVPTVVWAEGTPAGTDKIREGDDRIRELKTQLREIITADHKMDSSGQAATWGYHEQVTLIEQANLGSGASGVCILGAQTMGGVPELVYTDEEDRDVQLTKAGKIYLVLSDDYGPFTGDWSFDEIALVEDTAPSTAADEIKLYAKDTGGQPELFVREESDGDQVQITSGGALKGIATADEKIKAWASITFSGNTSTLRDSFNVASVSDVAAGIFTINWTVDFATIYYAVVAMAFHSDGMKIRVSAIAVGSVTLTCELASDADLTPATALYVIAIGDQA